MEYLLIGRNKISGTIGQQAFNTAISLSYLLVSQNRISGSLPEQQLEEPHSSTRRGVERATGFPLSLTILMASDLKLSGSLPQLIGNRKQVNVCIQSATTVHQSLFHTHKWTVYN